MPHDDQLQQLLENANRPWYRIENVAKKGGRTRAKVVLFDAIGGWFGINAGRFVRELNELDVDDIEVRLNSPGGAAFDGVAIMNALRAHKANVEIHVDGLAASAASVIAMGGDQVVMHRGATMMIHDAAMIAWGPAAALHKAGDVCDKISATIAGIYAAKAGGDAGDWRALMVAETWYDAQEAVDAGLADATDDQDAEGAEATDSLDLSLFHYAGRDKAPAPMRRDDVAHARATYTAEGFSALLRMATAASATTKPPATEPGPHHHEEEAVSFDTLMAGLRERLGITDAETGEDAVLAALDGRLTAQATTTEPPAGTMLIEEGVYTQMRADAAAGREARDQQISDRRDGIIATAMQEGRITAHSAKEFRRQLDKDEGGAAAILASLPENAVPVTEQGVGKADQSVNAEFARYCPTTDEEA